MQSRKWGGNTIMRTDAAGCLMSPSWRSKAGRVVLLSVLCGMFAGLGWIQPTTADAEILSTPNNTQVTTGSVNATASYVIMQRIQLDSTAGGDNKVVVNSLTLDDSTATAQYSAVRVYLSTTSSTTIPSRCHTGGQNPHRNDLDRLLPRPLSCLLRARPLSVPW